MSKWIDVKERLPKPYTDVLLYLPKFGEVSIGRYLERGRWRGLLGCWVMDVHPSHWRHMVRPPQKEVSA